MMRLALLVLGLCCLSLVFGLSCMSQAEPSSQSTRGQVRSQLQQSATPLPPTPTTTAQQSATPLPPAPITTVQQDPQPVEESTPSTSDSAQPDSPVEPQASVGTCTFLLELATTAAQHERGLMERTHLAKDHGMLFVWPQEAIRHFWMLNTLIPLDIFFINQQRRVVAIHTMLPEPGVGAADLTIYNSDKPAQFALEVNAGMQKECGASVGDLVELEP